jgi:iron complex transport system permease protein
MKGRLLITALIVVLSASVMISLLVGRIWFGPSEAISAVLSPKLSLPQLIVLELRLPRTVLGVLIGGILGLSGAVLQGLLRNPLAEPGLLGVSSGASLGAVIAIYYGVAATTPLAGPLFGLIGGLITAGVALALARKGGTLALILAGSAVSAIAASGVSLALNLAPNPYAAYEITTWLMGSLSDRSWDQVVLAGPFILVGGALLWSTGRALNALSIGEAQAESLGVNVGRTRLFALLGVAMGVGAATAVAGAIGFVGLVAPHFVRPFVGHEPSRTLLPATLAGAAIVTLADIAARLVRVGPELKLGVIISLVGAPFFLWLVLHLRKTAP